MVFNKINKLRTSEVTTDKEIVSKNCKPPIWLFWRARRYIVALLIFLGFINTYCLRVNLSVAIVAMTQYYNVTLENGTTIVKRDFDWDTTVHGYLLSSFFYGYICTQFIGAYLGVRFGGKLIFEIGIFGASILTIFTPYAAYLNIYLLIVVRILEGLFEGLIVPSCQSIWANWAPPLERSRLLTIGLSGTYLGTVICLPLSSVLASNFGWESIFYFFGAVGLVWCIFWHCLITNSPAEDPKITKDELQYIGNSLEGTEVKRTDKLPIISILTSVPVWALNFAVTSEIWGFYTLLTQLPKFMKYILKFDLNESGFISALPYLAVAFMVQFAGHIADFVESKNIFTTAQVRKTFIALGFAFQSTFIILSVHWLSPVSTTFCLVMALGFGGFAMAGCSVNSLDLSPKFGGILVGISNTVATVSGIISPIITGYIVTEEENIYQWRIIFYIAGSIYLFGAVMFIVFGSASLQPWDNIPECPENTPKEVYSNEGFQSEVN